MYEQAYETIVPGSLPRPRSVRERPMRKGIRPRDHPDSQFPFIWNEVFAGLEPASEMAQRKKARRRVLRHYRRMTPAQFDRAWWDVHKLG